MTDPAVEIPLVALDGELSGPQRIRAGDAAADLPSAVDLTLDPGARALVPTGFSIALPVGTCGLVLPRSGLALEHGVTVLNAPGLIDSGYRGELKVILVNHGTESVAIERGRRVAQLLVVRPVDAAFVAADQLPPGPDDRGSNGFGSSG